ncbi:alpha/beta-hydrolase [Serendipita vermifera]|nr:alpha/beta-hydrolase [Serendipita vermifera]
MYVGPLARIFPFLWPFFRDHQTPLNRQTGPATELVFSHRHAFVTDPRPLPDALANSRRPPQILFNDNLNAPNDVLLQSLELDGDYTAAGLDPGRIRTVPQRIQRAKDQNAYQEARLRSLRFQESTSLEWEEKEIPSPDLSDRLTVLELAKLTGNAYAQPNSKDWYSLDERWNRSVPFGWEREDNGFRGNIFVTNDNSTVVISIKGTSLYGQGPTAGRDKLNDNRMFSCCCAHVSWPWAFSTVCDCFNGGWTCGQSCVEQSLQDDDLFYSVGINLYNNVTYMYPDANIWIVGHSLGGGLSGLLGATFGAPTITFEALGDRLPASRLHLPHPPPSSSQLGSDAQHPFSLHPVTHIFHTADPVPHGACTGVRSLCAKGGYALEARCHLGKVIVYDTITKFGWSLRLKHHPIAVMIGQILSESWEPDLLGRQVPEAVAQSDCIVSTYKDMLTTSLIT